MWNVIEENQWSNIKKKKKKNRNKDFPGGTVDKNPPANAEDTSSTLGPGRFLVHHNYWACAPQQEKPPQWEAQALQPRIAPTHHN